MLHPSSRNLCGGALLPGDGPHDSCGKKREASVNNAAATAKLAPMGRGTIRVLAVAAVAALAVFVVGNALAAKPVTKVHLIAGNIVVDRPGWVRADGAAQERRRADRALRQRQDQHRRRRTAADPENHPVRIRQTRLGRHPRPAEMHRGETESDDGAAGAQTLPGRDRRQRLRPRGGQVPRTGPDPGRLADHALQRPGGWVATRRSSPTPISTIPAPTTFIVPVRIETIHNGRYGYRVNTENPQDRRRLRHPHLRLDSRSAGTGPTRARSTATSTPAAPTAACRRSAASASKTAPRCRARSSVPARFGARA